MGKYFEIVVPDSAVPDVDNGVLTVYRLLGLPESPELSLALIFLHSLNNQVVNNASEAKYFCLGGIGYFNLWNGGYPETRIVRPGDTVTIQSGTLYQDIGADLVMVSLNHPAYDPSQVKILE